MIKAADKQLEAAQLQYQSIRINRPDLLRFITPEQHRALGGELMPKSCPSLEQVNILRYEKKQLENRLSELNKHTVEIERQLETLEKENSTLEEKVVELSGYQARRNTILAELDRTKAQMNQCREQLDMCQNSHTTVKNEMLALHKKLANIDALSTHQYNEQLESLVARHNDAMAKLRKAKTVLEQEYHSLQESYKDSEDRFTLLNDEIESVNESVQVAKKVIQGLVFDKLVHSGASESVAAATTRDTRSIAAFLGKTIGKEAASLFQ